VTPLDIQLIFGRILSLDETKMLIENELAVYVSPQTAKSLLKVLTGVAQTIRRQDRLKSNTATRGPISSLTILSFPSSILSINFNQQRAFRHYPLSPQLTLALIALYSGRYWEAYTCRPFMLP